MQFQSKQVIDDEFFGSNYKVETTTSLTTRKLANDLEIQQLLVSDKLNPLERFKYILENGSNLQRWSILENLAPVLKNPRFTKPAINMLKSANRQYGNDLLGVMGFGLTEFMKTHQHVLSQDQYIQIVDLSFKILGYEQVSIGQQWIDLIYSVHSKYSAVLGRVQEYATGSFDLKASPSRRNFGILLIQRFFQTYSEQVGSESVKSTFLNTINGLLRNKNQGLTPMCLDNILVLVDVYGLGFLLGVSQVLIRVVNSPHREFQDNFVILFSRLKKDLRTPDLRVAFQSVLKYNNYVFDERALQVVSCLTAQDTDLDICVKLSTKSIQLSMWKSAEVYIKALRRWRPNKASFDRIVLLLVKTILVCPQSLNQSLFQIVVYLLGINKRRREFMTTLKQRMASSRCWTHRRNFVQLYEYLFKTCSWELMEEIVPLPLSVFINQKVVNIRLEHCRAIYSIYQHMNPGNSQTKTALKRYLLKYSEDKNPLVAQMALNFLKGLQKVENTMQPEELFERNRSILLRESSTDQMTEDFEQKETVANKALITSKQNLTVVKKEQSRKLSVNVSNKEINKPSTADPTKVARSSSTLKSSVVPISSSSKVIKIPPKPERRS